MNIAVIASYAPSLVIFRGPLLAEMVARGHTVTGYAPDPDPQLVAALAALGVQFRAYPLQRAGLNPLRDARTLAALTASLRRDRPDAALCYTIKPVIYGTLAARLAAVPRRFAMITGLGYAFTEADTGARKRRLVEWIVRALYRLALRGCHVVFFQNPDDRGEFLRLGLVREAQAVLVNGTGVDLDHYAPAAPVTDGPVFLLIARLLADKGIREYVAAARILKARYPQAVFRLVGPYDPNPAAIQPDEIAAWQAEGAVEYLGETRDVRPFIAACSVYVLPSFYREGTPRTVLEALAMGRPVVTTDAPGCRETVVPGANGFLVPPRDVAALAAALERFILQPGLIATMGAHSRALAVEKYDVHQVNAAMLAAMRL